MAKRYAIIIEENGTQSVEDVKSTKEVLELVLSYTDYFIPEEDSISQELIERNEFNELAKEIAFCYVNQEPQTSFGKRYCEILNQIYLEKRIVKCKRALKELNELLKESNHSVEVFLNEREDDGCGWNGEEE